MQLIPIKTRVLHPPQDSLFEALENSYFKPQNSDIILVSSKVVAIHQGRCIKITDEVKKEDLITREAEYIIPAVNDHSPRLTIKQSTLIGSAGIDESNAEGHYILWPNDSFIAAHELWRYFQGRYNLTEFAVIITDSHCVPLRWGVVGIALGFYGMQPTIDHTGKKDLFGRAFQYARSNLIDGLAAAGVLVMGEAAEQTPVCIARGLQGIVFSEQDHREDFLIPPEEDMYYSLLKPYFSQN